MIVRGIELGLIGALITLGLFSTMAISVLTMCRDRVCEVMGLGLPEGADIPPDANAPIRWAVFTLWLQQPEDEGKQYRQRIRLLKPNGQESMEAYVDVQFPARRYQTTMNVTGFPIGQTGMYSLQLALTLDEATEEIAEYPIEVKHIQEGAT